MVQCTTVGCILLRGKIYVILLINFQFHKKLPSNDHCQSLILSFLYRYLSRLKSYVRNRAAPEGSIAEGYIVEECLTFCSRYMEGVETIFNRPTRTIEESTGVVSIVTLDTREWTQAHRYVLFNSENINCFRE